MNTRLLIVAAAALAVGAVAYGIRKDAERNASWERTVSEVDACAPLIPYKEGGKTGCWDTKAGLVYFKDGSTARKAE